MCDWAWKGRSRKDGGALGGILGNSTHERKEQVHPPGLVWVHLTGLFQLQDKNDTRGKREAFSCSLWSSQLKEVKRLVPKAAQGSPTVGPRTVSATHKECDFGAAIPC